MPAGANGTPAFTPPPIKTADGEVGDVIVQAGARLTSPASTDKTGGRVALIGAERQQRRHHFHPGRTDDPRRRLAGRLRGSPEWRREPARPGRFRRRRLRARRSGVCRHRDEFRRDQRSTAPTPPSRGASCNQNRRDRRHHVRVAERPHRSARGLRRRAVPTKQRLDRPGQAALPLSPDGRGDPRPSQRHANSARSSTAWRPWSAPSWRSLRVSRSRAVRSTRRAARPSSRRMPTSPSTRASGSTWAGIWRRARSSIPAGRFTSSRTP